MITNDSIDEQRALAFVTHLAQVRASGKELLDLSERRPTRCGLLGAAQPTPTEVSAGEGGEGGRAERSARGAVAGYLSSYGARVDPENVLLAPSPREAQALAGRALCGRDEEVLVATPGPLRPEPLEGVEGMRLGRFAMRRDGAWSVDRRSLRKAVGPRTRAVFLSRPSVPTGALVSPEELEFLDTFCAENGLALVADESLLGASPARASSVAAVRHCLSVHLSGVAAVCGTPDLDTAWIALTGPTDRVTAVRSRLAQILHDEAAVPVSTLSALPTAMQGHEAFREALRERLAHNWSWLARASLREAPWSVIGDENGPATVLELGAGVDDEELCRVLLDEDGIVVEPGSCYGFGRRGLVVVSLLVPTMHLMDGLGRLEARLRSW